MVPIGLIQLGTSSILGMSSHELKFVLGIQDLPFRVHVPPPPSCEVQRICRSKFHMFVSCRPEYLMILVYGIQYPVIPFGILGPPTFSYQAWPTMTPSTGEGYKCKRQLGKKTIHSKCIHPIHITPQAAAKPEALKRDYARNDGEPVAQGHQHEDRSDMSHLCLQHCLSKQFGEIYPAQRLRMNTMTKHE